MKHEVEILKERIKALEKENQYLKGIIKEAGLNYETKSNIVPTEDITPDH